MPMRKLIASAMVLAGGVGPGLANAGVPLDGSAPLLCALTEVQECEPGGACQRRPPEAVNLPAFLRIDVKAKRVGADDASGRTAPIHDLAQVDGRLIMYGGQEGRSWSAVILGETGRLSAGVVNHEGGFLIFGACTTP
jgi:hypothetical protein